jgi:hypothetical protein
MKDKLILSFCMLVNKIKERINVPHRFIYGGQ